MVPASWMPLTKAEAGVGEVEVQAAGRQAELVVHRHRGGRLQIGPGHRGVDHDADLLGPNTRLGQGFRTRHRRGVGESHIVRPPAPFDDPGQLLQHARPDVHPLIGLRQPLVDRRRGDHDRRLHRTDREHGGVDRPEACVTAHVVPSCPGMPLLPPRRPVLHHRVTTACVRLSLAVADTQDETIRCTASARLIVRRMAD